MTKDNTTTTENKLLSGTVNGMYFQAGVPFNDFADEIVYINGKEAEGIRRFRVYWADRVGHHQHFPGVLDDHVFPEKQRGNLR